VFHLAHWVWTPVFIFTACIALPAIFLTPGSRLIASVPITAQGLRTATYLLLRSETAVSLSMLLVLSTRWAQILKALRVLRVPVVFVVILGMTYRYLFLILETALDMFESRESRTVGVLEGPDRRRLATATIGVLLSKSYHLSADVHLAMQSRGFRGEVYMLDEFAMRTVDWYWLLFFFTISAAVIWVGR
jgi:cobalt ECF transporter T component CbiQ